MAFKKSLAERLFNISKISSQTITNCRISSSSARTRTRIPQNPAQSNIAPDPGDATTTTTTNNKNGIFRRFLHKRAATISPELRSAWIGPNLVEKLREIDISKDRINFDGLAPPPASAIFAAEISEPPAPRLTVDDVRKLLKVAQLEMVKTRLREMERNWIPYSDFVGVCSEVYSDREQGIRVADLLDQSGSVIVLGNVVFIKPEQVTKAIEGLIPLPGINPNDPRRKELEEMENQKAEIDKKAESLVRRELWAGLGYLLAQTAGFMRLTFWELTWDVMEPICFYVTSMYFMACYAFFLRTSKEPSFEGFYESRFSAKQKRLMKIHNFDAQRYNELRNVFYPYSSACEGQASSSASFGAPSHTFKCK